MEPEGSHLSHTFLKNTRIYTAYALVRDNRKSKMMKQQNKLNTTLSPTGWVPLIICTTIILELSSEI